MTTGEARAIAPARPDAAPDTPSSTPPNTAPDTAPDTAPNTAPTTAPDTAPRGLVGLYRRLSGLVAGPAADAQAVTTVMAGELGVLAAVVGPAGEVLAAAAPGTGPAEASALVRAEARTAVWPRTLDVAAGVGRALRVPGPGHLVQVVAPVLLGREVPAFVLAEEDTTARDRPDALAGDDALLLVAEHAATVVGVLAGRDRVLATAAGQVRGDLVSGLLLDRARDADQAAQWAEHLGYDHGVAHRVVVVSPDDDAAHGAGPASLLGDAEEHLLAAAPTALTVVRDTETVAVVPEAADPGAVGAACARRLARGRVPDPDAHWPVTVAVGGTVREPGEIATSYDQARRTLVAARRLGRSGRVLRFDDLGVHRLLLQIPDPEAARAFAHEVLGRLATDRSERTVELLRTLARYFLEDGSPQRVAKALNVHPNTVGYRLRRAEEQSGLDLDAYRDRLAAQVALEILGEMEA
ncbi:PucR family transcriptional regulator [Actinomycetospora straminea]|uniref:PucR-like helix-turn-helix protein n=1 Tax=Actinomycetospora straminea TaxID=663607 RepID=A0ABP9EAQ7_9PSEU|nr:helix-turn-helix domain-containing protein [Actinomycetospora straminea]MDD7936492.1 helix-turn-helix domain-containing protein [Actinomycetospora straminea]